MKRPAWSGPPVYAATNPAEKSTAGVLFCATGGWLTKDTSNEMAAVFDSTPSLSRTLKLMRSKFVPNLFTAGRYTMRAGEARTLLPVPICGPYAEPQGDGAAK